MDLLPLQVSSFVQGLEGRGELNIPCLNQPQPTRSHSLQYVQARAQRCSSP